MEPLIVLAAVFAVFLPALILPGPDFIAVSRSALMHGPRTGLLTAGGVSAGLGLYATLSLLGLSAILVQYQWLTWAVRCLGGAYLVLLGISLLRSPPATLPAPRKPLPAPGRALLFGFLVTLSNPKAIVLFASVFATAVTAATPGWLMALMIVMVIAFSLAWYATVSLAMGSAPVMRRLRRALHRVEQIAGFCFIGFGGKLIADTRNPASP